jgi:hypothetical protein
MTEINRRGGNVFVITNGKGYGEDFIEECRGAGVRSQILLACGQTNGLRQLPNVWVAPKELGGAPPWFEFVENVVLGGQHYPIPGLAASLPTVTLAGRGGRGEGSAAKPGAAVRGTRKRDRLRCFGARAQRDQASAREGLRDHESWGRWSTLHRPVRHWQCRAAGVTSRILLAVLQDNGLPPLSNVIVQCREPHHDPAWFVENVAIPGG